jgi:hypothetical protein
MKVFGIGFHKTGTTTLFAPTQCEVLFSARGILEKTFTRQIIMLRFLDRQITKRGGGEMSPPSSGVQVTMIATGN